MGRVSCQLPHIKLPQNLAVLKQCSFTILQFLWVRNLGMTQLVPVFQNLSQAGLQSSLHPAEKDLLPSSCGLGRTKFPIGCWLEATFRALSCGPLQHGSLLRESVQAKAVIERVCQEDRSHDPLKLNYLRDILSPLPCSVSQKQVTRFSHTQGQEGRGEGGGVAQSMNPGGASLRLSQNSASYVEEASGHMGQ